MLRAGLDLDGKLLALAAASHSGEAFHVAGVREILAGAGLVVYGLWEADGGKICRRNQHDAPDKRRCVTYERVDRSHFRNSDGVGFCLGPCESDK